MTAAEKDTLPQWLYERYSPRNNGYLKPWEWLGPDDQTFWAHEAAAVRRAVARNGFRE